METDKNLAEKCQKMTLKDYYESLPQCIRSAPRRDFLNRIAKRCDVTISTVYNWINYGMRPMKKSHAEILSEETGIPASDLWPVFHYSPL